MLAAKYVLQNWKSNAFVHATDEVGRTFISAFRNVSDAGVSHLGKIAWFRAEKLANAVAAASDLCDYYGRGVIQDVQSRAEELGKLFQLMCAGRFGSSDAVNQGYMRAVQMIANAQEDPFVRLGIQKVLSFQAFLGPVNGTDSATLATFQVVKKIAGHALKL